MNRKKITITCTKKQAKLIEIALDTLSRMVSGQLHEMIRGMDIMRGKYFESDIINHEDYGNIEIMSGYKLGSYIEEIIKPILFPQLHKNESYGVGMKELGNGQIAYEMVKKLQNFRTEDLPDAEGGVLRHEPLHYSKEPLITITESKEEK